MLETSARDEGDRLLQDFERFDALRDRFAGVLLGSAVADALGWPTEFIRSKAQLARLHGVDEVRDFIPWEKVTGGRFNSYIDYIQPGDYSDDTQLTLSTARSIRPDGSFDGEYFAKRELPNWLAYARGAGATVTRAAKAASRRQAMWNNNFFVYESKGRKSSYVDAGANGAAMRISPLALANRGDEAMMTCAAWENTIVTHGHPRAIWGALVYAKAVHTLINNQATDQKDFVDALGDFVASLNLETLSDSVQKWIRTWQEHSGSSFPTPFEETRSEMKLLLSRACSLDTPLRDLYEQMGCFDPSTKGSGTATVAAAIGVFMRHGGNYEKAVMGAVNMLGSDTDTIAAMVGGLVCARKGQMAIPDRWANAMQDYGYFLRVTDALARIALREAMGNDLYVDHNQDQYETRDVVSLSSDRAIHEGQRVTHSLFGLGWVQSVNSQQIKRRGGGTMLLAKTIFDSGQSCVFRSYKPAGKRTNTKRM
ncbi:MAG: ADP-ribosylglycohydrolase family protein [Chloroflexota bacterium]|nr:ADP-ribosylglycohydrolase family protein [Chloroflexota bacterium]MDE2941078.1 ADP-ribosylglycohydrolase family protein [Chloroflexota bacterium]MDE3267396.1 ADP-ribosylglycohydrolase family protein [Chloroflexota bacterium]